MEVGIGAECREMKNEWLGGECGFLGIIDLIEYFGECGDDGEIQSNELA